MVPVLKAAPPSLTSCLSGSPLTCFCLSLNPRAEARLGYEAEQPNLGLFLLCCFVLLGLPLPFLLKTENKFDESVSLSLFEVWGVDRCLIKPEPEPEPESGA